MNVSRNSLFFVAFSVGAAASGGCDGGTTAASGNTGGQVAATTANSVATGGQSASTTAASATGGSTANSGCVDGATCTESCTNAAGETCNCGVVSQTLTCTGVVTGTGGAAPLASTVATCTESTVANKTNVAYAQIVQGSYFVFNNTWSLGTVPSGTTTEEYVWTTCNNGSAIGWGGSFNWPNSGSSVMSYQAAVLGWHWGWPVPIGSTGMPLVVGNTTRSINCSWSYAVTRDGTVTMNVSYDLWIHNQKLTGSGEEYSSAYTPTDEVMIWLFRSNGAGPISSTGSAVATNLSFGGAYWDLYTGLNGSTNVYSFVRQANADSGATLNLQEFLTYLTSKSYLSSSKYLSSIEAGFEVYNGTGQVDTSSYGCYIQ